MDKPQGFLPEEKIQSAPPERMQQNRETDRRIKAEKRRTKTTRRKQPKPPGFFPDSVIKGYQKK